MHKEDSPLALFSLFSRGRHDDNDEPATEERSSPSAQDPVTADHWIVQRIEALTRAGYMVTADTALQQSTVFACVRVLAETIASLPLCIYKRGPEDTKEEDRDHSLWQLLHVSPNSYQTALEFFEMLVGHQCLRGNGYSFIERSKAGDILRLIPLHPDQIKPELKNGTKYDIQYVYKDNTGQDQPPYSQRDIWHLKGLSTDGFVGLSPIAAAKRTVQLARIAEDHGIAYFSNGARASGFFKHPGKLSKVAKENLKESGAKLIGENKFSIGVLEEGLDWESISLTNEDSQYLETRNFQILEIARLFRVPAILIGHPDKASTYASAEQFMLSFVVHTIRPWLVRIEQSINKYLLSESDQKTHFAKFKVEGLLRGDTKTRYEAYASAIQARWMTPNEVRKLEDMNPIEGGDELKNPAIDPANKPPLQPEAPTPPATEEEEEDENE